MQLQQNGAAGWIRLVIELVLLAAVLVLVIWKRREIGDALLSAWYSLRHWIQQHLRKNKRVKSVRSGVYGEGEQGVTIVELR